MTKLYLLVKRFLPVLLLATCSSIVLAQGIAVSGRVKSSDDGSGAPGVNILIKGTSTGTVTDADGNYRITAPADAILVFSFVGYTTQEVPVGSATTIDVSLVPDVTALQEVIVVGYGEIQKKDATGAVVNMSTKDFNKGVIANPQDLIVGKFAGVSVTSNSGAPGSGSTIRIRGGSSLGASNDPLIVIDGYPVDNAGQAGVSNALSSLNPNDIETFTVLKDASATAIYGSRASNGVIIVTTKKGKEGKTQFSYNGTLSFSDPVKFLKVQTGDEYRALIKDPGNLGLSGIDAGAIAKLGTANTDWQKEVFQTGISQDHNIGASGSIKKVPYRITYGYTDQKGILKTTSMSRHSMNINLNPTLLDGSLKLNLSAKGSYVNNNFGDAAAVGGAIAYDPTQPVYDPSAIAYGGYSTWLTKGILGPANPVALLNQTDNQSKVWRIITNAQAEYKLPFFPDIKLNVNVGFDQSISDGYNKAPLRAAFTASAGGSTLGRNNSYSGRNQSELTDIYFVYNKQIDDHKIEATAGYGWQHFYREGQNTNSNTASTLTTPFKNENYLVSFFGRLNYAFKGKYLLTATLRDDGSSRFSKANRWGLFPSVALAWRLKDESFLSGVQVLSDLKLRAGYGVTGQQEVGGAYYPYLATYRLSDLYSQYQLGSNFYQTLRPEPYDSNIKWESATTYNLGVDFGFMEDKITGSIEVYQKNTSDLLNYVAVANGVNFSNYITTNVGSIENKGIELTLRATAIQTKNLTWNIGMNFTSYTSKITKLNLTNDPTYLGVFVGGIGVNAFIQNHQVGFPAFSFFPYQQVYADATGKPIEGLYVDRSGKGGAVVGSDLNKYHDHKPAPDFLVGINSRVNYKKFDFSFSGRLSVGNYVYNNVESGRAFYNGLYTNQYLNNIPKFVTDANFTTQQIYSDYYVQNASFFKMDNLSLGYTIDQIKDSNLKARVSVTMQNAFVITNYKGIDPEVDGGIDNNIYPRPRVILLGVNLTF